MSFNFVILSKFRFKIYLQNQNMQISDLNLKFHVQRITNAEKF